MQKFLRTLTLMALMLVPWVTQAQTLTVADGTETHQYVPFYGYFADDDQQNQMIYPATDLSAMVGKEITQMVFYYSSVGSYGSGVGNWTVSLGETSATSLSGLDNTTTLTQVFSGNLDALFDATEQTLTITFDDGYTYNGGNLLVEFSHSASSYRDYYFYGIEATGAAYCYNSVWDFLPKTTFSYETPSACAKPTGLAVNYNGGTTAQISWTSTASAWNISVNGTVTPVTTNPYTLTNLSLSTTYEVMVQADCGSNGTSAWTNAVSFTTPDCWGGHLVTYTMNDSYGDGWNGAAILVTDACGNVVETLTMNSGSSNSGSLSLCGEYYKFVWQTGSYDSECSFTFSEGGSTLFTTPSSVSDGLVLGTTGINPCPDPTGLAAGTLTVNSADLSWTENGTATAWQLCVNGDETNLINVTTNPFTLTDLAENTDYTVKLRANCGEKQSCWTEDINFTTLANCVAPTNATASNITAHDATISWTSEGNNFIIMMGEEDLAARADFETGAVPANFTTTTSYPFTAVENTHSGAYCAKSSNEGVNSSTSDMVIEVALANAGTVTFSAMVSSESNWDKAYFSIDGTVQSNLNGISGAGSWIDYSYPLAAGTHTLRWYYTKDASASGNDDRFYVDDIVVSAGVSSWNNFTATASPYTFTGLDGETAYQVKVVNVCTSGNSDPSNTVAFTTEVACPAPTGLAASNPTTSSVDLAWTENGSATAWQICVNGDETNLTNATTNPFTLTGLAEYTEYTIKVRANCGGIDGVSEWSNTETITTLAGCQAVQNLAYSDLTAEGVTLSWTDPNSGSNTYTVTNVTTSEVLTTNCATTTFDVTGLTAQTLYTFSVAVNCATATSDVATVAVTTPCAAVTIPFTENFDSHTTSTSAATGVQPDCWTLAHKDVSWTAASYNPQISYGTSNAHSGSYSLRLYYRGIYAMPPVNVNVNQLQLHFWVKQTLAAYQLEVGVMSDLNDASTFVPIETINNTSTSAYEEHTIYFNQYTGNGRYIAFHNITTNTYNYSYNYIDDITVDYLPSCFPVSNLAADVTSSSVTLSWTDASNSGATYTVYDMSDNSVIEANVNATTYTVGNLTANTPYEFGVRANCSATDESDMTTISTRTACGSETIPFTEDFSASLASNPCWSGATGTTAAQVFAGTALTFTAPSQWNFISTTHDGLPGGHYYRNVFGSSVKTWMITPEIDLTTAASAQLSFDVALTDYNNAALPDANGDTNTSQAFMVIISTDGGNTWLQSNATIWQNASQDDRGEYSYAALASTTYLNKVVNLNQYLGQTIRIAFYCQSIWSGGDNDLHIDNIAVTEVPECSPIANLTVSDVTTNSAVLTWADNDNDNATYTVKNGNVVVESGITATTYTLTGLTPNTTYTFAVVANCAVDAEPVEVNVTTLQVPATLPYTTGFETGDDMQWTLVNGTNGWYFGEAATDEGNSLYISNDNGVSNDYTKTTSSNSYAYRMFDIADAGYYTFAFDWKAYGESNYDYMRVFVAPATANAAGYTPSTSGTPTGWYALDGGSKLNLVSDWQNAKKMLNLEAGSYQLVFVWRNDNSQGTNPPAAVDNIVVKAKSAFEPTDFTAENISATSATLTWTANPLNNGTETYTLYNNNVEVVTGITGNNYTATLTANTDYNFSLVAVNGGDNSDAVALGLGVYEYPTQDGKMVYLGGTILNTVGNTSTMTLYRGLGADLTEQANYTEGTYLTEALTTYTASNDWPVYGPMTVIYMGETATSANTGVAALTPGYKCPMVVSRDAVEETANGAYTWTTPEGAEYTYENHRDAALALNENGDIVATYTDTVRNAGKCDSIINTLQLTLHPDFVITVNDAEICEGETYTLTNADQSESFSYTATGDYTVLLHSVYGADSVVNLSLQMHPAPVAYINGRAEYTMNDYCDNFELTLTAGSSITGVNYEWEDASTDAVRTVTPHINNVYTLTATDPVTGCSSLTAATLTVNTQDVPVLTVDGDAAICFGQSATLTVTDANAIEGVTFRWRNAATDAVVGVGATLTVSPTETTVYTVTAEGACDVTSEPFTVTVNPLPVAEVATSATVLCAGAELTISATEGFAGYEWSNGATTATSTFAAATTGSYTVTVTDANGCVNEFTTANVTVNPVYELNDAQSVCFTQNPYTWGTQTITENGNYDQTFQTVNGCDSLVHLTFTFEEMSVNNTYREVCQNTDVTWGETTYPAVQESATLTYIDNSGDCPEQKNLVLTVNPVKASSFEQVVCDSYLWPVSNETYTESGAYPYTLQTVKGCDSVVTMNLTVNYQNTGIDEQTACDRYEWIDGNIYTESNNTATYTLQNALGCDSVVTLNLTVNYKNYAEYAHTECDATSYTWLDGETYNIDVEYNENGATYTYPGITNAAGCDSIAVLHLTMNYVLDTLNWTNVTECDNYYLDVVQCDGSIVREYFAESGDVVRRTRNAETGRDRISRIHLTINNSEHQTVPVTACVPYTWNVSSDITIENINPVANDTVISQELVNEFGCNVIKVLRLTVLRPTENVTPVTLCQNDSWTDDNNVEYLAANYELGENERVQWNATTNAAGCDSIDYVVFTVNPVYNVEATLTYCENEFTNNAITYANPNNAAETIELTIPGALNQVVYNNTVVANWTTATGCDSIVTITYTVNPTRTENVDIQSCYTYTWNETEYNVSGDYTFNTQTVDGCDSTATLHLTIADTVTGIVNIEACGEYTYKGVTYRESMTFVEESGVAISGCDSVTHFVYHITPRVMKDVYVVANAPYTWDNGETYTAAVDGIYYDATEPGGCDSILVLHLTMEQPIVICEGSFPYNTGYGVTIDPLHDYTESYAAGQEYSTSWGSDIPTNSFSWGVKYEANQPIASYRVQNVSFLYTNSQAGAYTFNVYTDGDNAPANLKSSKTVTFESTDASGWKTVTLDVPVDVDNQTMWVTITATGLSAPAASFAYAETDMPNSDWFNEDGNWDHLHNYSAHSWMIATGISADPNQGVWFNNDPNGNDTIIYYTVNRNSFEGMEATACNSYEWNNQTYTESGIYTFGSTDINGCDSTAVLTLTVNVSTDSVLTDVACDSYTWSGINFTESADTTLVGLTNAAGCDSTATLHLTINVNEGTTETVAACNSYEWQYMDTPLTTSGTYNVDYYDGNNCLGQHNLTLTVNYTTENTFDSIVNAASTYYNGNYYADINEANGGQPYTFDVTHTETDANGCPIIDHVTLYVTRGTVIDTNINMCGNYTWINGHTYAWIDAAERAANGNALYKDITDETPVYIHTGENPTFIIANASGVADTTFVLWLNMIEANYFTYALGDIMLSDVNSITVNPSDSPNAYEYDVIDSQTIDLAPYIAAKQSVPDFSITLHHTSTYYCENVVTYTANLIYNFDTVNPVTVCDVTSWTDPVDGVHTVTIGAANDIDYITTDNWHHHVVVNVTARTTSTPQVATACDTYTWTAGDGQTYTISGNYPWNDDVNCTAETLQLTINNSNAANDTKVACDTYTWINGTTYTASNTTDTVMLTNVAGCDSTVTLNLTINNSNTGVDNQVACDSYTWINGTTYTASNTTDTAMRTNVAGCDSVVTLNLTINHNSGNTATVAQCLTYTWNALDGLTYTYNGAVQSGDYVVSYNDANTCPGYDTLHLTIYDTVNTSSERFEYGNGFTFHGSFYTPRLDGTDSVYTIVYDTVDANNCAIKDTLTLHVSQYIYTYINKVECGSYTWTAAENGNDHTYRTLTADEIAANPTAAFYDVTANAAVANMQQNVSAGNIYVLNLTLNEAIVHELATINVPMSQLVSGNYTTTDGFNRVIDCNEAVTAGQTMLITKDFSMDEEGMGPFPACDSIVRYFINVIYNYVTDDTVGPLCAATTYEVVPGDERTISVGDNTLIYVLNAGLVTEEVHTVVVTNKARTTSAPQVVTVCDTYTWTAGDNETYTTSGSYTWNNNDAAICSLETLNLTVNSSNASVDPHVACDTYTWINGTTYTASNTTDTVMRTNVAGCDSTVTLNLTINNSNTGVDNQVACDSYTWINGTTYTASNTTDTAMRTNVAGCDSVVTLNLTINTNEGSEETVANCYTYTWNVPTYVYDDVTKAYVAGTDISNTYTESGVKTVDYVDANGCSGTATLNLTINGSESIDTAFWFGDGSYRYTGIFTTATAHMYTPGDYAGIVETVNGVTANGCDSIYNITLHVGNNYTHTDAVRSCATYTWNRNNTTYARLTDAQAAEYPTAIYFDQTNNEPVYYNPVVVEPRVNDYADEYMLDLTLDAIHEEDVVVDLPVFPGTLTYGDSSYNVALADHDMGRVFVDSTFTSDVHFGGVQYCDSIVHLTVNVINNYVDEGVVDLCYTESSYTWEGESIVLDANPDVLNEYYIYHVDAVNDTVKYQKVIQHPIQYVTERRVECDSYEWRGTVYTENTSGVVRNFTDQYGCDSTVTLVLTINHTTSNAMGSEAAPIVACDGYEWILSNNEAVSPKYTESGVYTMDYTSVEGCPSTDTLYLTINNSTETTVEAEGCGNYTWMNGDETVGTYTASGTYTHTFDGANVAGCDSTVTLTLTIHELPAIVYDAPDDHVCDAFVWTAQTWNGTEMVDTVFATITETAYSLYDTAYNEFGCPIPHYISAVYIDKSSGRTEAVACDSYEWHGTEYTESGAYEYVNPTTNACGNPVDSLYLTINKNSGHMDEVAICNSNLPAAGYEWNGSYYSTTGEYYYDYADDNSCASTDTLRLTIGNVRTYGRVYVENCGPYTWDVTGETFTESTEVSTIMDGANAVGCDSVIMLYLTIYEQPVINETVVICDNELVDYSWRGIAIDAAGEYTDFGGAYSEHCDSVYNLTLTVNERTYSSVDVAYCDSYEWNGETYTESGVYTYTTTNAAGCDNIDTLHLTINVNNGVEETELACDSYEWNGTNYTESGDYTVTYQDANGCSADSVLHLTIANSENNSVSETACDSYEWNGETYTESGTYTYNYNTPDGCAGVKTLELTVNSSSSAEVSDIACDSYEWNGETYTASGVYTYTTTNAAGCDSVVTLNLTINYNSNAAFTETACDSYEWNGTEYITSGDYTYSYTNAAGCASTDTLHLTVNYSSDVVTINETACDSYEWTAGNGETYTESGAYTYTTTNAAGCDSTVTLNLTINTSNTGEEEQTACDSYTWNGETYTESGVYTFNTTNAAGCDSTATLNLTINTSNTGVDVQTACDTYTWIDNNVYTASNNTATYTLTNAAGCDSVVTLNLTINNSVATSFADEACNAYVWEGSYYTESGAYTKTFEAANGCDSVVTLTLTINQPVAETITETACGSYTWNGITYNASGNYTQTDVAANGCDSVTTLVLTINQPVTGAFTDEACESYTWNGETYTESGAYTQTFTAANGCDSVVTLTLTINAPANTTEDVTACESYTWHGQVYTTNGAYTYNFTDNNGCAAVATLNLTINTPANTTETVTACNSYSWNNQTYTNSGVYTSTFVDANGCNATATLSLTINNPVNATFTVTECESYTWHGQVYTVSGNYTYTTTAANGCDSIETLVLTINQPTTATEYAEACGSYTWNGTTYTQPGAYPYTTTGSNGCDSTVTLLLNLVQPVQTIINQTACDSYIWNGTTYTTSGSYSVTETAANGCDSVVTLNLTINNSVSSNFAETACNSYTWNGQAYTTSGTYTQVFTAHNGCDSTVTLNLTINTPTTATVTETACSSFDWNGETYTTSGSYTYTTTGANGCDSVTTLLLTINLPVYTNLEANAEGSYSWNGETYTESGVYTYTTTAANGCDSVVTLTLTITPVYTVTLVSQNEAWGSVSESGTIAENGYFTATATANEGYEFVAWLNSNDTVSTSSTYIFQVTEDITLTAVFAEVQGISAVDMNNVVIYSTDSRIFVNGAEGYDVYVYDVNGRVINRQMKAADAIEFRMTTTGVYLVKVGNAPAKRVVVVR